MTKHLKRQLMVLLMGCFTAITVALVAFIVIVPSIEKETRIRTALESFPLQEKPPMDEGIDGLADGLADSPSKQNHPMNGIDPQYTGSVRDFGGNMIVVALDGQETMTSWNSNRNDYYADIDIETLVSKIKDNRREFGKEGGYYFLRRRTPDGFSYTILDASASMLEQRRIAIWTVIGGLASWMALFLLSLRLVDVITRPIQQAFDRQTRFIADAGHELKTPIAVIQANADVLETEQGRSKWLTYIKTEAHRMDGLVKDLMFLTSLEHGTAGMDANLNLSSLVEGTALPFEALAYEKGMSLDLDVQEGIIVRGNHAQLEKLVWILLENAIKYGDPNGTISVSLGDKHHMANLRVYNTGMGIQECEKQRIFERFYRVDKSRSRAEGSYGLGLAMAKEIADNSHGRISVESKYGEWIEFTFEMKSL